MISIISNHTKLNIENYPEVSDKFWYNHRDGQFSSFKQKMLQWGGDYFCNKNFNNRIYELIQTRPLKVLDLGCGGAGFIEDCLKDDCMAVGLDGNHLYKELQLHAWSRFPNNLFACDICKHFKLVEDNEIVRFDLITCWECLEHLYENDIDVLCENIKKHSKDGTYFIFSANQKHDPPSHKTIKSLEEWKALFSCYGFESLELDFGIDVVRYEEDSVYGYLQYKENLNV